MERSSRSSRLRDPPAAGSAPGAAWGAIGATLDCIMDRRTTVGISTSCCGYPSLAGIRIACAPGQQRWRMAVPAVDPGRNAGRGRASGESAGTVLSAASGPSLRAGQRSAPRCGDVVCGRYGPGFTRARGVRGACGRPAPEAGRIMIRCRPRRAGHIAPGTMPTPARCRAWAMADGRHACPAGVARAAGADGVTSHEAAQRRARRRSLRCSWRPWAAQPGRHAPGGAAAAAHWPAGAAAAWRDPARARSSVPGPATRGTAGGWCFWRAGCLRYGTASRNPARRASAR